MNVSKLMQRDVATVLPGERLDRAAKLLADRDCGSLVVVDEQRRPVAMVTDRDVCLAALRTRKPLADLAVDAAMSRRLYTCTESATVAEAESAMALHQVRRLPVVGARGSLVGLLALDDIAREACRQEDLIAPPVSCAAVGRTLGQLVRPHLIEDAGGMS